MITQAEKIFEKQTSQKTVEILNSYNCESLMLQVQCDTAFQIRISGRVNSQFEYQPMSVISDNFNVYSDITQAGTYNIGIGGKTNIVIDLLSIGSNGELSCYANLF